VVFTKLSREIAERETVGIRVSYYFSCHAHHVDSKLTALQQAGDAETSDTASKRPRLEIEDDDQLQELAANARRRIRQEIGKLDQPSISYSEDVVSHPQDVVSRPHSVSQLSNPTFDTKLPFPFVGHVVPSRFHLDC